MRQHLIHMNQYFSVYRQQGTEPLDEHMGARERSLRIFDDEKAPDNMKPEGWNHAFELMD